MNPINPFQINPFELDDTTNPPLFGNKIHIWCKQRTTRTHITTIEGLDIKLDLKKLLSNFKKKFNCNGSLDNNVIKLSGDQRYKIKQFLIDENIASDDEIVIHGF